MFYKKKELMDVLAKSRTDAKILRADYNEYERIADNGLIADLDEYEPEVNDGSLSAALFKLPKRIINKRLTGRFNSLDEDDDALTELANVLWENVIIPKANMQLPFARKWKDAVRKSAIYGGQPIIVLPTEDSVDIIVPQATDVILEANKISDLDCDVIFWDIYYTKKQVRDMIEEAKTDKVNKWHVDVLKESLEAEDDREEDHQSREEKSTGNSGIRFTIAFQKGVDAPFYMCLGNKIAREWKNPDPTGALPVHYLYCYQDLINPYGIGIVKLAGGTQNVLDFMRRQDVLATQVGLRPPKLIEGTADDVDEDSLVYAADANWFVGNATVKRMEVSNNIYSQLPSRLSMYKTSLNQLIPTGDTSISASAGDPKYSKTPAGVKFQAQSLSIDDDDYRDNLNMTYESVAKNMMNTYFANMEGTDVVKLPKEAREALELVLQSPVDGIELKGNILTVEWDKARTTFDFSMDAEDTKAQDEEARLEALLKIVELKSLDPTIDDALLKAGKKLDMGNLFASIISLTTDNKEILRQLTAEEEAIINEEMNNQAMQQDPAPQAPQAPPSATQDPAQVAAIMNQFGVEEDVAIVMLEGVEAGIPPEKILAETEGIVQQ